MLIQYETEKGKDVQVLVQAVRLTATDGYALNLERVGAQSFIVRESPTLVGPFPPRTDPDA